MFQFPANPTVGQQVVAPNGFTYQWNSVKWFTIGGAGGSRVYIGPTPPTSPNIGDQWWDSTDGQTSIWTGSEWVQANCGGGGASGDFVTHQQLLDALAGKETVFSETPPSSPNLGDLWYDTTLEILNTWNGSAWVPAAATDVSGFLPLAAGFQNPLARTLFLPAISGLPSAPGATTDSLNIYRQIALPNGLQNEQTSWIALRGPNYAGNPLGIEFGVGPPTNRSVWTMGAGGNLAFTGAANALTFAVYGQTTQLYSDNNYWGIGFSSIFANTTAWRLMFVRSSGQLQYNAWDNVPNWVAAPNGNFDVRGTLTQGSDARSKHDIQDAQQGLDVVRAIQPKSYIRDFTPDPSMPAPRVVQPTEIGFVAQDVQEALPQAVSATDSGSLGVAPMALVAVLWNAVKELSDKVSTLEAELARSR